MLKPQISQLLNENESAYALVVAVARRSRDIAEAASDGQYELYDKPINIAIDEFGDHRFTVKYDEP